MTRSARKLYVSILIVISIFFIYSLVTPLLKGKFPIKLGLDISGGVMVSYLPDFSTRTEAYKNFSEKELLALCKETLAERLRRKLNIIPDIFIRNDNRIIVNIPDVENYQEVLNLIGQAYHLTIRLVLNVYDEKVPDKALFHARRKYFELGEIAFSGDMLDPSSIRFVPGNHQSLNPAERSPKVGFSFASPYDEEFEKFTRKHQGKELAILLDNKIQVVGTIEDAIKKDAVLSGNYTKEEAEDHVMLLKSGNLPISLKVDNVYGVSSTLGQEVKESGVIAMLFSIFLLLIVIVIAYLHRSWFLLSGMFSLFCLLFAIAGFAASFRLTLDFAGIAGIILAVGMGMDAFIIIFESLEEKLEGFTPRQIARNVHLIVRKIYSFSTEGHVLFHANATTLLVVILLIFSDRVKSFAFFIIIGVLASFYTIFVTRELLQKTYNLAPNLGPSLLGWIRGSEFGIFPKFRKPYILLTFCSIGFFLYIVLQSILGEPYIKFGTDFNPGTQITCETNREENIQKTINEVANQFREIDINYQKLMLNESEQNSQRYIINLSVPLNIVTPNSKNTNQTQEDVQMPPSQLLKNPLTLTPEILKDIFLKNNVKSLSLNSIDSKVSSTRFMSSLTVLGVSFIILAFYLLALQNPIDEFFAKDKREIFHAPGSHLWVSMGVLFALLHDISFIIIACYLLNIHISLAVIAGILTIIGYSVNDSVVLWCNIQAHALKAIDLEKSPMDVVSFSVDSILSRAFLTSISTMIPAISIIIIGISELRDFAWVMLVGTIAGTFSSIFIVGNFALKTLSREKIEDRTETDFVYEDSSNEDVNDQISQW